MEPTSEGAVAAIEVEFKATMNAATNHKIVGTTISRPGR
jgi:hypothetical protein